MRDATRRTLGLLAVSAALTFPASAADAPPHDATQDLWQTLEAADSRAAVTRVSRPRRRLRALTLDHRTLAHVVAGAPPERSRASRERLLLLSLPTPDGGFQRFAVEESPVMEPGLAARHPEIKTYSGRGLDDARASIRFDLGPLGFHASVRGPQGSWYIDPVVPRDTSLYRSYFGRDLVESPHGPFAEREGEAAEISADRGTYHPPDTVSLRGAGFAAWAPIVITISVADGGFGARLVDAVADASGAFEVAFAADPDGTLGTHLVEATDTVRSASGAYDVVTDEDTSVDPPVGDLLRTYRLALLTDPTYAAYFGAENVTAAKVSLINRVTHVYETETAIRLVLIANNDLLNLDTPAQMTGANGPCGTAPCFTAMQAAACSGGTLTRIRQVIGLLAGASSFDVGHLALGTGGLGVATMGVVGGNSKAQGCTGVTTPVGDLFAVDFVAHEMGHQFGASHTYNGTQAGCNMRSAGNSIEPGSGSSIMGAAGLCQADDLQAHADPYWSLRSFDEITNYVSAPETNGTEVQMAVLTGFDTNGDSFRLRYNGRDSAPLVRGTSYTATGVRDAILSLGGWPTGAVTVSLLTDTGFTVTFGGSLLGTDVGPLSVVDAAGCTGFVGEIAQGGPTTRRGLVTPTGNSIPIVTAPASLTIPLRTPFALTGSAVDPDGDPLTFLWEQNDRGGPTGTPLLSNTKTNGPLFRQFGTAARVSPADALGYDSPGENVATDSPTRVFPDLAQILANDTNAETGTCPAGSVECFSEFLPTSAYVGIPGMNANPPSLHFRLTARDGRSGGGAVNNATTTVVLATNAGPFLVTAPNTAVTFRGASTQTVTWDVANTAAAPVSTFDVKIRLSVDGGLTYPFELAPLTPNDGSEVVLIPDVATTRARVKVEAVGNVFFDVSNQDFTVQAQPVVTEPPAGGRTVQYSDSISPPATISVSDADSPGSALVASAAGLPAGLALAAVSISADATRPGMATWAVVGTVAAAPGTYDVTVTVSDETGGTAATSLSIVVGREDAQAVFTGDTLAFTSRGSTVAEVLLRATVRDGAVVPALGDKEPGDITKATVSFREGGKAVCGPLPLARLEGATSGTASCVVPLWPGAHAIEIQVEGYYRGAATAVVEVAEPEDSEVDGAGLLLLTGSGGTFKADAASPMLFATDVKYDVKGKRDDKKPSPLRGQMEVAFRSRGRSYLIKTAAIDSFGVARRAVDGGACLERRGEVCVGIADIRATASLVDVTDLRRPAVVASALSLEVTVTDRRKHGSGDSIGISLWKSGALLFSSYWTGSRTLEQTIAIGAITVR